MENIKGQPPMERPREKLQLQGPGALSDAELLAILFGSGSKGLPVSVTCDELLARFSLKNIPTDKEELCKIRGIGAAKAMIVLAVFELSRRMTAEPKIGLKDDRAIFELLRQVFHKVNELQYILVLMTGERELLATAEAGCVLPELTWVTGLAAGAGAKRILLARNGWLRFSRAEYNFSSQLIPAAAILGIKAEQMMIVNNEKLKVM